MQRFFENAPEIAWLAFVCGVFSLFRHLIRPPATWRIGIAWSALSASTGVLAGGLTYEFTQLPWASASAGVAATMVAISFWDFVLHVSAAAAKEPKTTRDLLIDIIRGRRKD